MVVVVVVGVTGKKTALSAMPFETKNASFCQDRLGTSIGKTQKKCAIFSTGGDWTVEDLGDDYRGGARKETPFFGIVAVFLF